MIKDTIKMLVIVGLTLALSAYTFAKTQEYSLVIDKEIVNITEKPPTNRFQKTCTFLRTDRSMAFCFN
jgi:hypothetical protein